MILMLSVLFLSGSQPILMVVSLIMITLIYSFYMYTIMSSFWYSYALILVMLSGVLVVFTYMVSLSPNEKFEMNSFIYFFFFFFMYVFFMFFMSNFVGEYVSLNLWMSYIGMLSLFMIILLFGVMIMIVWVSCKNKGALYIDL